MLTFEIIHCDWHKRRSPGDVKPISLHHVENLTLQHNSFCDVFVDVSVNIGTQTRQRLKGRVIHNQITGAWTINAVGSGGVFLNLKVIQSN